LSNASRRWLLEKESGAFEIAKEEFGLVGVEHRRGYSKKEAGKVKTTIIALFAAVLIATAPAVLSQQVSTKTPDQHHKAFKKRSQAVGGYARWRLTHATNGATTGYPGASSYAPSTPKDYTYDNSRNGGGGGGGGGSGM
jgi:hypothetical protein